MFGFNNFKKHSMFVLLMTLICGCTPTVTQINDYVNRVPYKSDIDNWGQLNYVSKPHEFYKKGGDCEDYVTAKIHEIKKYGLPVKMYVIVGELLTGEGHAVLKVKDGERVYILDNESNSLLDIMYLQNFKRYIQISSETWLRIYKI